MTYQQTVLNDKPAGFWMITAASGTSETDLSGNAKTATITEVTNLIDRAYRPLVTGTDTDRAYRFYNTNHKLTYPALEAWEVNREHVPFSIELTYQSIDTRTEFVLFAPQEASSTYVPDNGLYIRDNALVFTVSNGSSLAPATLKAQVTEFLNPGQTYHVVAVYDQARISLYVDGKLAGQSDVPQNMRFAHTTANFITTSMMVPTDTVKSEALVDAVSFYRRALTLGDIKRHYVMSTPNVSDLDIVNSRDGKLIRINDEDATKNLAYSARERGWTNPANTLTDLIVDDDGNLSLKKIEPAKLITGPNYYGNLLTWDQANCNADWIMQGPQGSIATTTSQSYSGTNSMEFVANGTNNGGSFSPGFYGLLNIPNAGKKVYTFTAWVRAELAGRQAQLQFSSYNGIWTAQATNYGTNTGQIALTAGVWTQLSVTTAALPENTGSIAVSVTYSVVGGGLLNNGEKAWVDQAGLWEGSARDWVVPRRTPSSANTDYSSERVNLFSNASATFDSGVSQWASSAGGQTITHDTTDGYENIGCLKSVRAAVTGDIAIAEIGTVRITPGKSYTASVYGKSVGSNMNVRIYINWLNAASAYLSSSSIGSASATTNAWSRVSVTATAPAGAAFAQVNCQGPGNSVIINEGMKFDNVSLVEGGLTSWTMPLYNVNEIDLRDSRMLLSENISRHIGQSSGGIGGYFDVSTTENDHIQEQCVAAVSSSNQDYLFEIVKKSDKNLYLRYQYRDLDGVTQTTEASWGAISSLLGTQAYFYLEWAGGLANLYINSTSSPAVIAFDAGVLSPKFDYASYAVIGGGADKTRTWNNYFKWVKLYNRPQPTADFEYNKTSVNGYTLKLANSLNVSQTGSASISVMTGVDTPVTIDQTQITWSPRNNDVVVKTSPDGVNNLLTYAQATVEPDIAGFSVFVNSTISRSTSQALSGSASLAVTSTGALDSVATTETVTRIPVAAGKTYTAVGSAKSSVASRSARVTISWYRSNGTTISQSVAAAVPITTTGWTQVPITAVAPAESVTASLQFYTYTPTGAGEITYWDEIGIWEGTSTTWGEPYQVATNGSEIIKDRFPTTLPAQYFSTVRLSTDDSYYRVTKLNELKMDAFTDSACFAENGWDQIEYAGRARLYTPSIPMARQPFYGGAHADVSGNMYLLPVDDRLNTSVPQGGSGASLAGAAAQIRTIEFWLYPVVQGGYVYYDGPTEYSMSYYNSGGFVTNGFTTLYVDGVATANTTTSTTWYNRWHHIILTNASTQLTINTDGPLPANMLTANQASIETDMTGLIHGGGGASASIRVTSHSFHGGASVQITTLNTNPAGVWTGNTISDKVSVVGGRTYTASAMVKAGTISRTANIFMYFYNDAGVQQGSVVTGTNTATNTTGWVQVSATGVAPSTATKADLVAHTTGGTSGDLHYYDCLGIWEGTSRQWTMPGTTNYPNILTPDQASIETGITFWGTSNNTQVARITTAYQHGGASLEVQKTVATGHINAFMDIPAVAPGRTYTFSYDTKSPNSTRGTNPLILWQNLAGSTIEQSTGSLQTMSTSWNRHFVTGICPPGAVKARVYYYISNAVVGEIYHVDRLSLNEGTSTNWTYPDSRLWLGRSPFGAATLPSEARYQNIAYYPNTFTVADVQANYKAYLGDVISGSGLDTGSRTLSDTAPKFYSDNWESQVITVR